MFEGAAANGAVQIDVAGCNRVVVINKWDYEGRVVFYETQVSDQTLGQDFGSLFGYGSFRMTSDPSSLSESHRVLSLRSACGMANKVVSKSDHSNSD